jgi:flagellar hook-associated protein 2
MTFGGIGFSGLASGLDTGAIISQLVTLERLPIQLLETKKTLETKKRDLIGDLKSLVQTLQDKADALKSSSKFLAFSVTASAEGVASFSASGGAVPGSHSLEVESLASADIWAFDGVADADADLASGAGEEVQFTVGGTAYAIALDVAGSSLNEIAAEIADVAGEDVTASVVNVGTESSPSYQLVIASRETGRDQRITGISSSVAGLTIDGTGPDVDGNPLSANNVAVGMNAVALVDGLRIERSSNEFGDVLPGVGIQVLSANDGEPITFTVAADTEAIQAKVQALVDAYNDVISFINEQNEYSEDEGTGGELFGDSLLTSVRSAIRNALFDVDIADVQSDTAGFSTLGLIGIESSDDGTLSIDESLFQEKLAQDLDAVMDLFADLDGFDNGGAAENTPAALVDLTEDRGLADALYRAIDRMFGTFTAGTTVLKNLFDSRLESIDERIDGIDEQIERKEAYIERFEAQLIARFTALEQLMGTLNAQGSALASLASTFQQPS